MITRRSFLQGSAAGALGIKAQLGDLSFARFQDADGEAEPTSGNEVLVVVFLRGGADFLNMVVPTGGVDRGHYESARSLVRVDASELISLGEADGVGLGLHPAMARLGEPFADNKLAIVLGAGLTADTRSHFDAMRLMEYGAVDDSVARSGWLARLSATSGTDRGLFPAAALSSNAPDSFATSNQVVALPSLRGFEFPSNFNRWQSAQRTAVRAMYDGSDTAIHLAGRQALAGSNVLELNAADEYVPANGVEYEGNGFAQAMSSVAQLIKLDIGLATATVDLGGWDTHSGQGNGSGGEFGNLSGVLADGLSDFYADLNDGDDSIDRTTVVVMSEFGRRVQENASAGTDHGHGGTMFVLGGSVNGGLHGTWPGLDREVLYQGADLEVTTDYRRVLSDIAIRRFGNNRLGILFPGYADHEPLNLTAGDDLEPDYAGVDPGESLLAGTDDDTADAESSSSSAEGSTSDPESEALRDSERGDDTTRVALTSAGVGLGVGVAATLGIGALSRRKRRVAAAETDAGND